MTHPKTDHPSDRSRSGETPRPTAPFNAAFLDELAALLNRHSMENGSDTPDFILAEFLAGCLTQWNAYSRKREAWYGVDRGGEPAAASSLNGPMRDWREYVQHKPDCAKGTRCAICGEGEDTREHAKTWGHTFSPETDCTCGLDQILAADPAPPVIPQEGHYTVEAAYVLGGWRREGVSCANLARVIGDGCECSPLGEVRVIASPAAPPVSGQLTKDEEQMQHGSGSSPSAPLEGHGGVVELSASYDLSQSLLVAADALEAAPVYDDMGLSLAHTQAADVMRRAAEALQRAADPSAALPDAPIRQLIETWRKEGDELRVKNPIRAVVRHQCADELFALLSVSEQGKKEQNEED